MTRKGQLDVLDRVYDEWRERGAAVSRQQFPALVHGVRYRSTRGGRTDRQGDSGGVVAPRVGGLGGAASPRSPRLFKEAVLSRHQSIHGEPPPMLHGHGFITKGYEIARYLALPDVGYTWSRGRIHGLALWMPPGCEAVERRRASDAAFAISGLIGRGIDVPVQPRDDTEDRPVAVQPDRWRRASRLLGDGVSCIHERRRALDLTEVAPVVPSCRFARAGGVSVGAYAGGHRRGRPRAGGSEPPGSACASVLAHRTPFRGAC